MGIGFWWWHHRPYWYLSVVNSGSGPVVLKVSSVSEEWPLAPGEARTYKMSWMKDRDAQQERQFTMTTQGKSETLGLKVPVSSTVVFDTAGSSCFLLADYGPQYRDDQTPYPEKESDIVIKQMMRGRLFVLNGPVPLRVRLGEILPKKLGIKPGMLPQLIRFIQVPCQLTTGGLPQFVGLYNYLNTH